MPQPWTLEAWIEHCRQQREEDAAAVALAHTEMLRRLQLLNGEAARIASRDNLYVSSEKYETAHAALSHQVASFLDRYQEAHQNLADRITDLASQQKGAAAAWAKVIAVSAIMIAAATVVILIVR